MMSDLLQFVWFKDLDNWSVKNYLNSNIIKSDFEMVLLGNLITPRQEKVKKQNYKNDIELVKKISFKDGVIHLREKRKSGMDMYKLYPNDLLVSKINFHQGALAINNLKKELLTSTHYQPYIVNPNICKKYLTLILRSKLFQNYLFFLKSDGIKTESTFNFIKTLKIPLPPLEIQQKIVKNYQNKLNLAKQQTEQVQQKEAEIETYLYQELGIELPEEEKQNTDILQFVRFKDLGRWDVVFLLNKNQMTSVYDVASIHSIVNNFLKDDCNNSLRFDSKGYPNKEFQYIGMENIEKESGKLLAFQDVKGIDIKSQTIRLPKGFFLYGKLRPYLNKYFYNDFDNVNIITSSEFFAFSVKNINELYFKFCLSSSFIQHQIINHMKGARMPRIGENVFKNLQIPLPPLKIQNQIAEHIQNIKNQIQTLKQQAKQNQENALSEFEAEIFTRQASIENNNAS